MKKAILILLIALTDISLQAQETSLTLEVIPGKLASQLTKEQMSTVQELTLTGEMYNCDFYIIRDSMPELKVLDLKNVLADSIPDKAFAKSNIDKVVLPLALKYVGEKGFERCWISEVIFTGDFPQTTSTSFLTSFIKLSVSKDNPYCKIIDDYLCSIDGKKLYLAPVIRYFSHIPEGIETICKWAFNTGTSIDKYLVIPSSVKFIEDEAFAYISLDLPVGRYSNVLSLFCNCTIPPKLGENVFAFYASDQIFNCLYVPIGCLSSYQADPEWCKAALSIEETEYFPHKPGVGVSIQEQSSLNIIKSSNSIQFVSDKIIKKIEIIDLKGNVLNDYQVVGTNKVIDIPFIWSSEFYFMKIVYNDGNVRVFKLIK